VSVVRLGGSARESVCVAQSQVAREGKRRKLVGRRVWRNKSRDEDFRRATLSTSVQSQCPNHFVAKANAVRGLSTKLLPVRVCHWQ
jgi:hypothetical protein